MNTDVLGSAWDETEVDGWQGRWRRIGNTNEFDAQFTHPSGKIIGGRLRMTVEGNTVHIHRWNPNGAPGSCAYVGTFSGRTVSGSYYCIDQNGRPTPNYQWNAVIS
jgi:hypothetical protein